MIFEFYRETSIKTGRLLLKVITNPMMIAAIAAVLLQLFSWKLIVPLETAVKSLSSSTTSIALLSLGASFEPQKAGKNKYYLIGCVSAKLLILPAAGITASILSGFRNEDLAILMVMFGSASAVNSYATAQQMGGDGELAGQVVVFSSAFSMLSIFFWIFLLKSMSLI